MALPQYAQRAVAQGHRLTRLFCKGGCYKTTYARLAREPNPLTDGMPNQKHAGHVAYCLVCGTRALDNYNWMAP